MQSLGILLLTLLFPFELFSVMASLLIILLQQQYSFQGILLTNSPSFVRYATPLNVDDTTFYNTNPNHLPLVNTLLLTITQRNSASYYGYMNSDSLLSPLILAGINTVMQTVKEQRIPSPVRIAFCVTEIPILKMYQKQLTYRSLRYSFLWLFPRRNSISILPISVLSTFHYLR